MKVVNQKKSWSRTYFHKVSKKVCDAQGPSKLGTSSKALEFITDYQNRLKHATVKRHLEVALIPPALQSRNLTQLPSGTNN